MHPSLRLSTDCDTLCFAAAAAAAIAKPVPPTRPSSFLQAAGGSGGGAASGPQGGRGGSQGPGGGGRGRGRAPPRAPPVQVPNEDFDFAAMMKKFNKQSITQVCSQRLADPDRLMEYFTGSDLVAWGRYGPAIFFLCWLI